MYEIKRENKGWECAKRTLASVNTADTLSVPVLLRVEMKKESERK